MEQPLDGGNNYSAKSERVLQRGPKQLQPNEEKTVIKGEAKDAESTGHLSQSALSSTIAYEMATVRGRDERLLSKHCVRR